jgi:hypothetical protein
MFTNCFSCRGRHALRSEALPYAPFRDHELGACKPPFVHLLIKCDCKPTQTCAPSGEPKTLAVRRAGVVNVGTLQRIWPPSVRQGLWIQAKHSKR